MASSSFGFLRSGDGHFPTTHATWIVRTLAGGDDGVVAVRRHVMERYRDALMAYAGALPARAIAEPAELVAGFFARRLSSPAYFETWQASGLPLRRYLMTGLSLDARTLLRSERREAERRRRYAAEEAAEARERARREADAEAAFERAWARTVVAEACERVRADLAAEGDGQAWEVFEAHVLRGESYGQIADALGSASVDGAERVSEEALAVCVRRVGRRMRAALRAVLAEEGASAEEIERELRVVLARLRA
ncbi:MAG: hypothetical protein LW806_07725 [Planctomycetaceae bacterium]|jgi:hypothetical protein|nr:hypothetical protein [Planctomycetaceae bacterium]